MPRKFHPLIIVTLGALLAATTAASRAQSRKETKATQADSLPELSLKVYDKIAPVMVKITVNHGQQYGSGSVVGITPAGQALILTACHVVASNFEDKDPDIRLEFYSDLRVKFGLDSVFVTGSVLPSFVDRANDLALLVTARRVRHAEVIQYNRSNGVKPPQVIAAAGFFDKSNRLNLQVGRIKRLEDSTNFFVSTAKVEEGYSGGPLIDKHGRMIGVNIQMSDDGEESYARPLNLVLSVVEGWLQSIEKKMKLRTVWGRRKYVTLWQQMYQDPKLLIPGLVALGSGGYLVFKPPPQEETIFGDPPPVP